MLASHVAEFDMTGGQQQAPPGPPRHYPHPMIPHYPPHSYGAIQAPGQPSVKSEPVENRYLLNGSQGMPPYALPPLPGPQIPGAPRPGAQPAIAYTPTARTSYTPAQPASSAPSQPPLVQKIPQVDGPSSSGSDSPSPPPHGGYAPHSQHPSLPQPAQASSSRPIDSEAINSDLDDSDSEEEEEAQEEGPGDGDIVFCTYDKVARVKNKWKCILKDGMIHVNGKDYLFAKCTGEFEW